MASRKQSRGKSGAGNLKHLTPRAGSPAPKSDFGFLFPLLFGLLLGLALLKFGNPVILNDKVDAPGSLAEAWQNPWPPVWSGWLLLPLAAAGGWIALQNRVSWPASRWLWILPLLWFGWQLLAATQTVDAPLTRVTLWQLGGCLACYFLGAFNLGTRRRLVWLLAGLLAALTICLVRAVDQKLFEFPQERQQLLEGERMGWTNFAPEMVLQMKSEGLILTTNGVALANPAILAKYAKGRVFGTLVYPNALAGAVLLLWPVGLAMAFSGTHRFRKLTRGAVIALTLFLGLGGLLWSGSKSGWLIVLAMLGVWLTQQLTWSRRVKVGVIGALVVLGLAAFGVRFHQYFSAGAPSVDARFGYWRAAAQITIDHPLLGTGPGTFQRPYAAIKLPDAEMARMTHNDFLEQFCDSGIVGGLAYLTWILLLLTQLRKVVVRQADVLRQSIFIGVLGWFAQGFSEFSLYVPALAWTAFALAGALLGNEKTESMAANGKV